MIKDKFETIKHNIKEACEKAGRDPASVRILAVSKVLTHKQLMKPRHLGSPTSAKTVSKRPVTRSWEGHLRVQPFA